jgi:hypothetical protein
VYDEGMRDDAEDFILIGDVVDLLGLDKLRFLHDLDAGVFVGGFLLDEAHRSEGSYMSKNVPSPRMVIIS